MELLKSLLIYSDIMVRLCAVVECSNRSNRDVDRRYFRFPSLRDKRGRPVEGAEERRRLWIQSLHREDFPETKIQNAVVCSDHFLTGKPLCIV